ncbi:MAG: hypothetical protein ACPGN3_08850 [Opitutales bacterium]
MIKYIFRISIWVTLASIINVANAQSSAGEEVDVTFTAISLSGKIGKLDYYRGSRKETLQIVHGLRTPQKRYVGPKTLFLYEHNEQSESLPKEEIPPVASVNFPSSGNFIVFISKEGTGYRAIPALSDPNGFRLGMYRIVNMASFDLALQVGQTTAVVKSRQMSDIDASAGEGRTRKAKIFSLIDGEEPFPAFTGGLNYFTDRRMIFIIKEKKGGRPGRIDIIPIIDRV